MTPHPNPLRASFARLDPASAGRGSSPSPPTKLHCEQFARGYTERRTLERAHAFTCLPPRIRPVVAWHRADARTEHDLCDITLAHAGACGRHRLARRRRARLRVLHALRRLRHHSAA